MRSLLAGLSHWGLSLRTLCVALPLACIAPAYATPLRSAPAPQRVFPYGVSWYPEQLPESGWDADLALMHKAHISYVRVAEFSWAVIEPAEGNYNFGWLDRAITRAAAHGIRVVIGTPTAAPPAWLTTKYPDVLAVEADGRPAHHGWRRQYSVASARYRILSAGIAARLAQRYGHNPAVIGFQIDNEFGRETFDPVMRLRFQGWLKARYGSLEAFNREQFNVYWSLTYDDWSEVNIPGVKDQPGLWIDWLRFLGEMWSEYERNQIDAMRPLLAPDKLITTNFVAKYDEFDFSVPAQALDMVGWDWYFEDPLLIPADGAMQHDLYRGFLGRNPWVMETAAGLQSGGMPSYYQPRGETRAMVWQAIGHGADGYAFWVWRTPLNGVETSHGSVLDAAGRPRPIFDEIAQTGGEIAKAWPALRGSTPITNVAMIYDYPNRWAIERQPMSGSYDVWKSFTRYRAALAPVSQGVDVLRNADDLARYPLVVAPNLPLMSADLAQKLSDYVRAGGHLVIGTRSGVKNENSRMWQPSPLEPLIGARIDVSEAPAAPVSMTGALGESLATVWAERANMLAPDVETLLRYGKADGWLDGAPAVISRAVGKGRVTYVGAWLEEAALERLIAWTAAKAGVAPTWRGIPEGVEVDARRVGDHTTYIVINWSATPKTVTLPHAMHDLLSSASVRSKTLGRFDIAVLADVP